MHLYIFAILFFRIIIFSTLGWSSPLLQSTPRIRPAKPSRLRLRPTPWISRWCRHRSGATHGNCPSAFEAAFPVHAAQYNLICPCRIFWRLPTWPFWLFALCLPCAININEYNENKRLWIKSRVFYFSTAFFPAEPHCSLSFLNYFSPALFCGDLELYFFIFSTACSLIYLPFPSPWSPNPSSFLSLSAAVSSPSWTWLRLLSYLGSLKFVWSLLGSLYTISTTLSAKIFPLSYSGWACDSNFYFPLCCLTWLRVELPLECWSSQIC